MLVFLKHFYLFSNWIQTSIKHTFNIHFQLEKCETIYNLARMNLSKIICLRKYDFWIEIFKFSHSDKLA